MRFSRQSAAVAILGLVLVGMYASEPLFSVIDDEVGFLAASASPLSAVWSRAVDGRVHAHPPLHDIVLHYWLRVTGGQLELLRLPAIVIFVTGLWFCCLAVKEVAGQAAMLPAALVCALWPFGFHLGRVQGWYGLSFLLTALLTYAYLRCLNAPTFRNWLLLLIAGTLLVYTNYYGWVLIASLGAHFAWQRRQKRMWLWMAGTVTLWLVAFAPLLPGFLHVVHITPPVAPLSLTGKGLLLLYNAYALFAGESIAPWFLPLGIPVALALAAVVILTFRHSPPPARYLFACMFVLILALTAQGLITTKRTMTLGPWLVIPVGAALATSSGLRAGRALATLCVLVVVVAGYGVARPQHYAAPRYVEPWREVARREARHARDGALLLVTNPSFCFYLTHELQIPPANPHWKFAGVAPWNFTHASVMDAEQWHSAGRPTRPSVRLTKGPMKESLHEPTQHAEKWLDQNCKLTGIEHHAEDGGFQWKQRFYPTTHQMRFRVEVRAYQCP